jgi:hypothetical protein
MNHVYRRRREEIQTKSINNLFNKLISENIHNLEKEKKSRKLTEHPTIITKKETLQMYPN